VAGNNDGVETGRSKIDLLTRIYGHGQSPWGSLLSGLKTAMMMAGICSDRVLSPVLPLSPKKKLGVAQDLRELGVSVKCEELN